MTLSTLDVEASIRPDGSHRKLLSSWEAFAYHIHIFFRKSLQCDQLPVQCKDSSLIIPLFKKGSRCSPLNYRPISLTSVCCKTWERETAAHLYAYIDLNGLFNDNQFGFWRGRTVDDQLLLTYGMVSKWYDVGFIVDAVLIDFPKAFVVVLSYFCC